MKSILVLMIAAAFGLTWALVPTASSDSPRTSPTPLVSVPAPQQSSIPDPEKPAQSAQNQSAECSESAESKPEMNLENSTCSIPRSKAR